MAPKKQSAAEKLKLALADISELFKTTNRPYNLQYLMNATGSKYTRSVCMKALKQLTDSGDLEYMEVGKTGKLWVPNQERLPVLPADELAEKRAASERIAKEVEEAKARTLDLRRRAAALGEFPRTDELREQVQSIRDEIAQKRERLAAAGPVIDARALATLDKRVAAAAKAWKTRKRNLMEVIGQMSEGMDAPVPELFEAIGIETDEEAGSLPRDVDAALRGADK
eukprot:gnl/Chilomastix_cuspidata/4423.p3 GENE.gnl/Chilomastix_cuspidata/4423~~gnl/Chilomastix_cuspidata/4423.p3  ORF type:complete len:226 (+),score=136.16 gnl/Chilomastix_cuspidata/4423:48-725(+)